MWVNVVSLFLRPRIMLLVYNRCQGGKNLERELLFVDHMNRVHISSRIFFKFRQFFIHVFMYYFLVITWRRRDIEQVTTNVIVKIAFFYKKCQRVVITLALCTHRVSSIKNANGCPCLVGLVFFLKLRSYYNLF
jgi:hypothetical protein